MKRLDIDFAPRGGYMFPGRLHPAAWLAGAIALAAGAYAGSTLFDLARRHQELASEVRQARMQLSRQSMHRQPSPPAAVPEPQARTVNAAIAQLNLPWRDVFDAIEAATPATIALLSLEPDAAKQVVRGTAEAKNGDAMIAYIEELKKQPFFAFVVMTRHEVNLQDPNKPLRFQFEAQWSKQP
ncbi:MAG TPA: hypothetical protein VEC06_19605 [Paucimonas sp.]|nr:hypothetical protein [Paucimonas sp.]